MLCSLIVAMLSRLFKQPACPESPQSESDSYIVWIINYIKHKIM